MERKQIIIAVSLLVFFLTTSAVSYSIFKKKTLTNEESAYDTLVAENPEFAQATALLRERKSDTAIPLLEQALNKARNDTEKAHVEYSLALTYSSTRKNTDNYQKSISLAKKIIANNDYFPGIKALSVDIMDRLLASSVAEQSAMLITSSLPYSNFFEDKNILSLRKNLLSYGESFYPIADIEMKLAALHALDLIDLLKQDPAETTSKAKIEVEKNYIQNRIKNGDKDLKERIAKIPHLSVYTPEILLYKALAAERYLYATGEAPFGDVNELYKTALDASEKHYLPQKPFIEYYYSVFLVKTKSEVEKEKIEKMLMQYNKPEAKFAYMTGIFKNEKNNTLGEKENLKLLAQINPEFKTFLMSLGWTEDDFSSK